MLSSKFYFLLINIVVVVRLIVAWICPCRILSESDDDDDEKEEKLHGPSYHEEQEAIKKR